MKTITLLLAIVAIGVAGLGNWHSQAALHEVQDQLAACSRKLVEQRERLDSLTDFRNLGQLVFEPQAESRPGDDETTDETRAVNDLADKVQIHRRANDNQWQDIDYLQAQRLYHKKLIDQLNTDMQRVKLDYRTLSRQLRVRPTNRAPVSRSDLMDLKRRVNDLNSQFERGRR